MKKLVSLTTALALIIAFASCNKCYDCTLKCGVCTKGIITVAGCDGDSALNGFSVEAWKVYLENDGYTCHYDNVEEEACGSDNKKTKEDNNFECLSQ